MAMFSVKEKERSKTKKRTKEEEIEKEGGRYGETQRKFRKKELLAGFELATVATSA